MLFQPDLNEVAEVCLERLRLLASEGSQSLEDHVAAETNICISVNEKDTSLDNLEKDSIEDKDASAIEADDSQFK